VSPTSSMILSILVYIVIAIASYLMGRTDENRKWAKLWYEQWKCVIESQFEMENRIKEIIIKTRAQ
jgi:hypothetical protein